MQSIVALVAKLFVTFSAFYFVYVLLFSDWSFDIQNSPKTVGSLHSPAITILSWNPLIVYIRNFITENERRYPLGLSMVGCFVLICSREGSGYGNRSFIVLRRGACSYRWIIVLGYC